MCSSDLFVALAGIEAKPRGSASARRAAARSSSGRTEALWFVGGGGLIPSAFCMREEIQQEQHGAQKQSQVREVEVEPGERDPWDTLQRDEEEIRHASQEQALESVAQSARPEQSQSASCAARSAPRGPGQAQQDGQPQQADGPAQGRGQPKRNAGVEVKLQAEAEDKQGRFSQIGENAWLP